MTVDGTVPLKYRAEIMAGQSPASADVSDLDEGQPFLQGNAEFGPLYPTARYQCDVAVKVAAKGDLLMSVRAPVGALNIADQTYGIGRGLCAIRPENVPHRYVWWWLHHAREELESVATGSTFSAVSAGQVGALPLPDMNPERYHRIAGFLDRETAQIDAMIAKQEELVGLLSERRSAVIAHAVTKGLNPDAPMKDSGVEWLGEVPAHWTTMRLKFDLDFVTSGSRGWAEYYADQGEPFIRISNLSRGSLDLRLDDVQLVEVAGNAEGSRTRLEPSDLLFSITAYLGSVGLVPPEMAGAYVSQHVALARPSGNYLDPRYVGYFLLSDAGQRQLNEQAYGGTKMQLSLDDVRNLLVCVPPVEEQRRIADEVESDLSAMQRIIHVARESIELMRERRAALISDAVTGRLDIDAYGKDREVVGA